MDNTSITPQVISPFKHFCVTIGELPTSYLESMTYYEMLQWFSNFLDKTIIPTINNNASALTEVQNLYTEMKDYIDNYFNNLNVQNEINNKLDEMTKNGELEEIIGNVFSLYNKTYKTFSDLKNDNNIQKDEFVTTYGYNTLGDIKKANHWVISNNADNTKISLELNNGLYAILLDNELNIKLLNLEFLDGLNNYNLSNIKKIILDKNYTITNSITFNNMIIDGNNNQINPDLNTHRNIILNNNCIIKNATFSVSNYQELNENNGIAITITGNNNIIDNVEFNCYNSIYANTSINNLEIKNCLLNSFRHEILLVKGRFQNVNIHNNKQTRPQNYTIPVQHHNIIQILNMISWPLVANELTQDMIDNEYGDNIIIKNNEFNTINTRSINIVNCHNVEIDNNHTYNPFGDKVNHSLVGYSDDVYVLDLCKYANISNNVIINSGENGIDVLSSKYITITNNKIIGTEADGIDCWSSDTISENTINEDVSDNTLIGEHITCIGNTIKSVECGIRIGVRNSTFNGNTITKHEQADNNRAFLFVSFPKLTTIGNYGSIDCTGNSIAPDMDLGMAENGNTIFNSNDSNIIMDENSGKHFILEIDNSSLSNNSDTKTYIYQHNLNFKHFALYIEDPVKGDLIELPLTSYNDKGIPNYSNGKYYLFINTFKYFTNITLNNATLNFYNLNKGKIHGVLY